MEFKHLIFQAWKFMELNYQSLKAMEILVLFDGLVTADNKAWTM